VNKNFHTNPQASRVNPGAILVVSPVEADHTFVRNLFAQSAWQIGGARSWHGALDYLSRNSVAVVVCEKKLPDFEWKEVLASLSGRPDAPVLIVTSEHVDDSLWAEVLNLGGYDVLMKPFDSTEVERVINLARLNWNKARESAPRFAAAAGM
jgi:DNA-binding response OmpR family regulator